MNRPTLALVAVGVTAATALSGILWTLVRPRRRDRRSRSSSALIAGVPFRPGLGPLMVFIVAVVGYLTFAAIQNTQRRQVPNFDELEAETQRLARGEDLVAPDDGGRARHGAQRPVDRDEHQRHARRARRSRGCGRTSSSCAAPSGSRRPPRSRPPTTRTPACATRSCAWSATSSGAASASTSPGPAAGSTGWLRMWRAPWSGRSRPRSRTSSSTRARRVAELELIYDDDVITVMVTDQGTGFDLAGDRAPTGSGVRESIVERMESVGGSARDLVVAGQRDLGHAHGADPRGRRAASGVAASEGRPR